MVKATIYTAPKCPHSEKAKEFLSSIDVEFEERDVLENPDAFEEIRELTGQMAIPVIKLNGDFFIGFDRRTERRVKRKLGV
jgi:glutaredoxin 3